MQLNPFNFSAQNILFPSAMRRVNFNDLEMLVQDKAPSSGDIVLARVKTVGQKNYLLKAQGETFQDYASDEQVQVPLSEGQLILATYGNRYAVDEYRGFVPPDLGECHLVSSGGTVARINLANTAMDAATVIQPIGLVARADGTVVNLHDYRLFDFSFRNIFRIPCVLLAGTGMNAGKSTAAAALTEGLTKGGYKVGYAKVTGTGNDGDPLKQKKAGAHRIYDFTDCGRSTTYRQPLASTETDFDRLTAQLALDGCDISVVELADGIMMRENMTTLQSATFKRGVDAVLFAAADQAGAVMGVERLATMGYPVIAVSGKMTAAPLAIEEFLMDPVAIDRQMPCFTRQELCDATIARGLFETVKDLKQAYWWSRAALPARDSHNLHVA